jgi:NADPH2:quinone reductase
VNALTNDHGADVCTDMIGGEGTETVWTCMAREGRYVAVGFNDDPESGNTGRPLRKVSMGNFSVLGVMMGYNDMPVEFRRFGLNTFPPSVGREVHAALLELVSAGKIKPVIGRVISMEEVAAALDDHANRRTSGRTVVEVSS